MPVIRGISGAAAFAVRHPVLRKGKSLESCRNIQIGEPFEISDVDEHSVMYKNLKSDE